MPVVWLIYFVSEAQSNFKVSNMPSAYRLRGEQDGPDIWLGRQHSKVV